MNTLLITYELKDKNKDYSGLYESIKSYGTWWHHIETAWMIKTSRSPSQVNETLAPHINKEIDSLLIIVVDTDRKQGWLPKSAWDWINRN